MKAVVRALVVIALTGLVGLVGAGVASAHDALIGTDPADGSSVDVGPATVALEFSDVVQNIEPLITVTSADGSHWEGSPVSAIGTKVSVPVNPLGPAGVYTVSYRIVSADGHPVEGTTTFTLTTAGTGVADPATQPVAPSNSIPGWVWITGAVVVVLGVGVAGMVTTRRRLD